MKCIKDRVEPEVAIATGMWSNSKSWPAPGVMFAWGEQGYELLKHLSHQCTTSRGVDGRARGFMDDAEELRHMLLHSSYLRKHNVTREVHLLPKSIIGEAAYPNSTYATHCNGQVDKTLSQWQQAMWKPSLPDCQWSGPTAT